MTNLENVDDDDDGGDDNSSVYDYADGDMV